jgi:uncharacterized RmlC-like cupin family protein
VTTLLVEPGGGERIHWPQQGHDFILKIASASVGSFSLTEAVIPAGKGAGLHIHEASEECWYVLDGEYRFTVGDTELVHGRTRCDGASAARNSAWVTGQLGERTHTRFNVG